jgi:hypothetical protein
MIKKEKIYYKKKKLNKVFIDECGKELENEELVNVEGIMGGDRKNRKGGKIIIEGDKMKMGKVCEKKREEKIGLGL